MIRSAFHHLPGIGPKRLKQIQQAGIRDWFHLAEQPRTLLGMGDRTWQQLNDSLAECCGAFAAADLEYFVANLDRRDHWRILANYFDTATFFDIETSGLECDSVITIIACYHRGRFYRFFNGENLEEFLDLLEDVDLLVSFNGNSFDVPKVERAFHIPELPCPHLDLRWVCYHAGLRGGLKKIEPRLGILRPPDLAFVDGAEAVWLWQRWEQTGDSRLRSRLDRYCCADVAALLLVGNEILKRHNCEVPCKAARELWSELDDLVPPDAGQPRQEANTSATERPSYSGLKFPSAEQRLRQHLRNRRASPTSGGEKRNQN